MALVTDVHKLWYADDHEAPLFDAGGLPCDHQWWQSYDWQWDQLPMAAILDDDAGCWTNATAPGGVASSSSPSSSVLTSSDGQDEEYRVASTESMEEKLSSGLTATTAPASSAPRHSESGGATSNYAYFTFGEHRGVGGGMNVDGAATSQKRPHPAPPHQEANTPAKKHRGGGGGGDMRAITPTKTPAGAATPPPKHHPSLAAKNRRERISERLRELQELVPNGGKVDMVSMLERAISYVKFMQLQLKVLETDAFWPEAQTPPAISQVMDALHAVILSSTPASSSSS